MDPHQKVERVEVLNGRMAQYARKELIAEVNGHNELAKQFDFKHKQCAKEMVELLQID
ncbi:hypothetical protein M3Y14_04025 [Bacillus thuringiensis]|uniref:hypothetical protein n=1 Tax=Bacillus thuringiensis TaxID=1428 RepID=UPI0022243CEB|nr:hypothetical protein [Bacillus thuringiensis]UYX53330.1 hypothetical protein M3Y14_04025 [Bacillus thuringiensis]